MIRVIAGILLVLLTCTGALAESSVWKAHKGTSVIYLGGTFHILRESDFPLPPEFDKAYRASDAVVFETDLGAFQDPSTQQKLLAKALYSDGSTIRTHLSPQTYGELKAYCEANSIPLTALEQMKPSLLMITLTFMELLKLGVTQRGVDEFFYKQALKDKKTIEKFETVDQQLEYIVTMADGNENEFVSQTIRDMNKVKQQFDTFAHAWRAGDAAKLDELMVAELKLQHPLLYKRLIAERNTNWLPQIDTDRKSPRTRFILVGAAHLVGPDGIIEALKKKGYKIEQVKM